MNVNHQLRVGEPSAGDDLRVLGSGGLRDATGTGLDGIRTFLNPPAPDLISLMGMNDVGRHQGRLCLYSALWARGPNPRRNLRAAADRGRSYHVGYI